jgi:hypothetical protein
MPIWKDFVDNRMFSSAHWSKLEYCALIRRYHEHKQSAGIRIGFFENSDLLEGICHGTLGSRIQWGVTRKFWVIFLALGLFPQTLLPVKLDHRIAPEFRQVFWPSTLSISSSIANAAEFNLI